MIASCEIVISKNSNFVLTLIVIVENKFFLFIQNIFSDLMSMSNYLLYHYITYYLKNEIMIYYIIMIHIYYKLITVNPFIID